MCRPAIFDTVHTNVQVRWSLLHTLNKDKTIWVGLNTDKTIWVGGKLYFWTCFENVYVHRTNSFVVLHSSDKPKSKKGNLCHFDVCIHCPPGLISELQPNPPPPLNSAWFWLPRVSCKAVLVDSTLSLWLVQYWCSWCILYYLGLFNCWTISEKSVSHFIKVVPWRHEESFQPLGLNWFFWQFPISPSCCCHRLKQSPPFLERLKQESLRSSKCPKSTFN